MAFRLNAASKRGDRRCPSGGGASTRYATTRRFMNEDNLEAGRLASFIAPPEPELGECSLRQWKLSHSLAACCKNRIADGRSDKHRT
jgi:hypothetical protein